MGVSSLRELAVIEQGTYDTYQNSIVAVDAHHWLYRYITVETRYRDPTRYTTTDGEELPNVTGILQGLPTLLRAGIVPVFVFDGEPDERKASEIEQRRQSKENSEKKLEEAKKRGDREDIRKYKSRAQWLTPRIQETSIEVLETFGLPIVHSNGAGEGYAALLAQNEESPVEAVYTGDYDALLFGSPHTIRPTRGSSQSEVEVIHLEATLEDVGLTHKQLVDAAILIGTDYNDGISGVGPKRAVKYLQKGETIMDIVNRYDGEMSMDDVHALRSLFLHPPRGSGVGSYDVNPPTVDDALETIGCSIGMKQQLLDDRIKKLITLIKDIHANCD